MMKKSKDIKEIQDRITRGVCGVMAIFVLSLFLISGEKTIMYYAGIILCITSIIDFLIDILFTIKNKSKKNISRDEHNWSFKKWILILIKWTKKGQAISMRIIKCKILGY